MAEQLKQNNTRIAYVVSSGQSHRKVYQNGSSYLLTTYTSTSQGTRYSVSASAKNEVTNTTYLYTENVYPIKFSYTYGWRVSGSTKVAYITSDYFGDVFPLTFKNTPGVTTNQSTTYWEENNSRWGFTSTTRTASTFNTNASISMFRTNLWLTTHTNSFTTYGTYPISQTIYGATGTSYKGTYTMTASNEVTSTSDIEVFNGNNTTLYSEVDSNITSIYSNNATFTTNVCTDVIGYSGYVDYISVSESYYLTNYDAFIRVSLSSSTTNTYSGSSMGESWPADEHCSSTTSINITTPITGIVHPDVNYQTAIETYYISASSSSATRDIRYTW